MQGMRPSDASAKLWGLVAGVCLAFGWMLAEAGEPGLALVRVSVDGGAITSNSGDLELKQIVAQPEATPVPSSVAGIVLGSGFWVRQTDLLFRAGFEGQ